VPATPVPLSAAVSLASTGPGSTLAGLDIVCPGCTAGKGLLCLMAHCQQPLLHCGGPRLERCSMYSRLKRLCLFLPAGSGLPVLTVPLIKGYDVSSPVYWSPVDQLSNPGLVCRSYATNFIIIAAEGDAISQDAQAFYTHAFSALRLRSVTRQATVEEYAACLAQVLMVLRDDGPAATASFDLLVAAISGPLSTPTAITRVESSVTYLVQDCGVAPPDTLPSGEHCLTTGYFSTLHASHEKPARLSYCAARIALQILRLQFSRRYLCGHSATCRRKHTAGVPNVPRHPHTLRGADGNRLPAAGPLRRLCGYVVPFAPRATRLYINTKLRIRIVLR